MNHSRQNNFDLIRLFAATQVLLQHSYIHFGVGSDSLLLRLLAPLPGVPIFFVISGYLISAAWERNPDVLAFLRNRFLRIYPGLWVCFLVSLASVFLLSNPAFELEHFLVWVLAQLTMGQFYNPDFLRFYGVGSLNGSLWSIPVELQFYLVLPAVYWTFNAVRWSRKVLAASFVVLVLINVLYSHFATPAISLPQKLAGVTLAPYLFVFLIGMALHREQSFVERVLRGKVLWFAVGYAALIASYSWLGIPYRGVSVFTAVPLALLVISAAYTKPDLSARLLGGNDISYGIYIYHMVWVNAVIHMGLWRPVENLLIATAMTFVCAYLSWRVVERPCLLRKKQTTDDRNSAPSLAPSHRT